MNKQYLRWIPSLIILTIIFILSATPGKIINEAGLGPEPYHISGHFMMFFFLFLSFYYATKSISKSIGLTVIYAFLDELHQINTPGRSASFKDIFVDTLATSFGGGLVWIFYPKIPAKLKSLLRI